MDSKSLKVDKFTGRNNFSLWQIKKRHTPLCFLSLEDDIITEVAEQDTIASLWCKLESLYVTKSLTNKLLLKQCLFGLCMQEEEVRFGIHNRELLHTCSGPVSDNQVVGLVANINQGYGNRTLEERMSKEEARTTDKASGTVAIAKDGTNSKEDIALVVDGHTHYTDVWIMNFGTFYHIFL
ncbi:hypothetical protein LIER_08616 [Lithospermum erythrorhizon]|uniref:Uncharacterized protein n=1 Tax=Lithospermum erythrorhizon TaxID=34254 RepID=A0AAV3PCJ0_LITER